MDSPKLLRALLFTFAFFSYETNTAATTISSTNKPMTLAPYSNQTTANSTISPVPVVKTTTPSPNITTTHSNQTTANSTVSPVPIVNTTTPSPNITTTHSNQTTANSTVSPVPIVNTTTPSPNITTTTHSNHTTTNSTVTPAPVVNTTTPSVNTTTTPHVNHTTHSANSTTQHITHTTLAPTPTFSPKPSPPTVGNYSVAGEKGVDCIKALMGLVLVIHDKVDSFYNVEPALTSTNGQCKRNTANLNITFSGGFVNFNFLSDNASYFVDHIEVLISPYSFQNVSKQNLLNTKLGFSFRCKSKVNIVLGKDLGKEITLTMMYTRLQAFNITNNEFGKETVCSADFSAPIALAVGLTVVIIIILGIIIYLIYRRKKLAGYQRI